MVWFQCEDCGDNLKKPKLVNHFRVAIELCFSMFDHLGVGKQLSCIDCGQTFGQQSVQGHTQCITETEKYGPKGQGKASNGTTPKPKSDTKQKPEVDINVGLSERPPWYCRYGLWASLCNTSATSRQTLLLHAEGKKHKAKARGFHASKQQPKQTEEYNPDTKISTENSQKDGLSGNNDVEELKEHQPKLVPALNGSEAESGSLASIKKRKIDGLNKVTQVQNEETNIQVKKAKHSVGKEDKVKKSSSPEKDSKKKIKWKKLITSALKSNPDNVLKMRKLRKLLLKTLRESGFTEDESQLTDKIERKASQSLAFIWSSPEIW
ncbi:hypothetical protein RJ640_021544 [Escallonia rubra]|uniref:Zinc finger C2H2 LYAR-type domain-containing protein n=1 Tax=Escallonia rubra TaxID=112253 RepID=A0AA88QPB7_9ASTE|nr:hypothetical protein RJ640_021544 [Escallonia rubra]